jgi:hypothetical protein
LSSRLRITARERRASAHAASEAVQVAYGLIPSELGVAVHPYQYRTAETGYWKNYTGSWSGSGYHDVCTDIGAMINLWDGAFSNMPVFFTEDNWADQPNMSPSNLCISPIQCEGAYLADLFTWLFDKGLTNPSTSPIRLAWFTGFDIPMRPLGVRTAGAADKYLGLATCPSTPLIQGFTAVWSIFWYLDFGYTCYPGS